MSEDPTVQLVRGTSAPERLVCQMARNDYRSDGIIDHSFWEVMEGASVDRQIANEVFGQTATPPDEWLRDYYQYKLLEVKKRTLLQHLMRSGHWGPFEHPSATLMLEGVTRVSMAQITRHRHFTFDIMSLRYVGVDDTDDVADRFQVPDCVTEGEAVDRHDGVMDIDDEAEQEFIAAYEDAIERYRALLEMNVPQEEARKVLPMGTKVNIGMSGNARAWMHLLNIRGKANVQREARELAEGIFRELKEWMPQTFEHYDENVLPLQLNP